MNSDDSSRGNSSYTNRKPATPKYEKNHVYSPSTNYNYNSTQPNHGNQSFGNQPQGQRRKPVPFKRDSSGSSTDKLVKQNDIIIRLLKEIKERLPLPATTNASFSSSDEIESTESSVMPGVDEIDDLDIVDELVNGNVRPENEG